MHEKILKGHLPYRLRQQFLSFTELALLPVLREMAGEDYVICPKVSLNDIFYIQRPNENVHFYNKIFRKNVDFLLCDPQGMKPVFAVEVVRPNRQEDTRVTDQFMEDLFLSAGLPLILIPSSENYELDHLVNLFQLAVSKVQETEHLRENLTFDSAPACPECGLVTVLRIYRNGPNVGKRYYGCLNAPSCKGTIIID